MRNLEVVSGKFATVSENCERAHQSAVDQMSIVAARWKEAFPRENTWIQTHWGVPSILIRLDVAIHDGVVHFYEVEDRPAGIGLTRSTNPSFQKRFDAIREKWPSFSVVSCDSRRLDDRLWVDEKSLTDLNGELVYPRVPPEATEYHHLEHRCLSTLLKEGDKSYGVPMGLWRKVNHGDQLPWEKSFALHPLVGTRRNDLVIYSNLPQSKKPGGTVSRGRTERELEAQGAMYFQDIIPPMKSNHVPHHEMIFRFYFGYDPSVESYVPLGGLWNSRPNENGRGNYSIHGASDAVFGPISWEDS